MKEFNIKNYFRTIIATLCSFIFVLGLTTPVFAVEIYFESDSRELGVGQEFQLSLMIDPQGKEINAMTATIFFPQEITEVKKIEDGGSVLTLWIDRPFLENNSLSFSGIIPGGFKGIMAPSDAIYPGKVLTLTMKAGKKGLGEIFLKDVQVLLHDGQGTAAEYSVSNFVFSITEEREVTQLVEITDTTPPEIFTPEISQSPNILEGKWFLVFVTQDKGSGIDYYAVYETRQKKDVTQISSEDWIRSESPYLLKDQELKSHIFVKAVDRAGNERIVEVLPKHLIKWYEVWWLWSIIVLLVFIGYILWRIERKK